MSSVLFFPVHLQAIVMWERIFGLGEDESLISSIKYAQVEVSGSNEGDGELKDEPKTSLCWARGLGYHAKSGI